MQAQFEVPGKLKNNPYKFKTIKQTTNLSAPKSFEF
jgi:hypothetical protein